MALRALKTDDEISRIPMTEPVLVELPGEIDLGTTEDEGRTDPEPKRPEPKDGVKTVEEQLAVLEAAQKAEKERADRAEQREAEARKLAAERERELAEQRNRSVSLEGDVIAGGLAAAQAERDAAKVAFRAAYESGDADAMATAQSRIGRAEAQILSLESGAAEIAERKEREKAEGAKPAAEPAAQPVDVVAAIQANPNLLPAEKKWFVEHQEAMTNKRLNDKLGFAYEDAMARGLVRGSPAYFDFINERMGYAKAPDSQTETDVAAPVSRTERGGDGRPTPNKITLSPEQREIARSMGVSEIEYARQVAAFDAARKADPDKYR